jgi:hypothetical protein
MQGARFSSPRQPLTSRPNSEQERRQGRDKVPFQLTPLASLVPRPLFIPSLRFAPAISPQVTTALGPTNGHSPLHLSVLPRSPGYLDVGHHVVWEFSVNMRNGPYTAVFACRTLQRPEDHPRQLWGWDRSAMLLTKHRVGKHNDLPGC